MIDIQIDEEIHLEEYNPVWVKQYEDEKLNIIQALEDIEFFIEHFGSTSIPGMTAKPIVDILVGVSQIPVDYKILKKLTNLGYENFGEISPGRLYFRKRKETSFNIAVVQYGSEIWVNNIVLRDYLRLHQEEARQYSDAKINAYADGCRTLLKYSDSKGPYISELLTRARKWVGVD